MDNIAADNLARSIEDLGGHAAEVAHSNVEIRERLDKVIELLQWLADRA